MKNTFIITGHEDCGLTEEYLKEFVAQLKKGRTRVTHTKIGEIHLYVFTYTFWSWLRLIFNRKAK